MKSRDLRSAGRNAAGLLACSLLLTTTAYGSSSEFVDPSCLVSFHTADKFADWGDATYMCEDLEAIRLGAYKKLDQWSGDSSRVISDIRALEKEIEAAREAKNWADFHVGGNIIANALATYGLIACAETAGVGCAVAAVAAIWAKYSVIVSAADANERDRVLRELVSELREARRKLSSEDLAGGLSESIRSFNELCSAIKRDCL